MKKKLAQKNWTEKKLGRKKKLAETILADILTQRATPPYTPALPLLKNYTKIA
jgi:hypothetical protein